MSTSIASQTTVPKTRETDVQSNSSPLMMQAPESWRRGTGRAPVRTQCSNAVLAHCGAGAARRGRTAGRGNGRAGGAHLLLVQHDGDPREHELGRHGDNVRTGGGHGAIGG